MSTQPNKSTNRPSETDPATGPGANGTGPAKGDAQPSGPASPSGPAKGGASFPDATRPEGIAPVRDSEPAWSAGPSAGPSGASKPMGAPDMAPPSPQGGAPVPVGRPGAGGPAGAGGPGGPGGAGGAAGKAKRAVARLGGSGGKSPRRAQLQLSRLEPWSVMKFSFVMSLVAFIVLLVAVVVLYVILSGLGVFDAISETVNDLTRDQNESTTGVDAGGWFGFGRIFGYTVLVGALNVLLITALSTVGSVIYNLAADLVGGVEVTLKEAE
ncbi:Transmembrane protein of unknown function [Thermomonospora echinospora]|uniref:DUF3566 domain-containing protein n=1 Tax=Thermomonospora echinospora TaxID=1992 RepID=A0A1H6DF20_9ACTN|nr:DUF3566 domain-containing protein [Thermomonospora echinospora]SEG83166.1 Transmembrane protein of unknown function [Thermomonospora echinospora]